ncbi:amidohydrolase [Cordyceps fumosorosea ARSEF 2679]|uniref:Amidohydrolase n=1 Tax=Cordyceps fumosorosea (strain ARSEF 2679) TaxID=1081104 RepID=A0A167I935_CORFA|nr:amidohydrolase [Cordyceps fumosorosea ARSEF 2679]OAA48811.1 amidohydrolase [Cordyceps fumosorosea ARSEF 2679]
MTRRIVIAHNTAATAAATTTQPTLQVPSQPPPSYNQLQSGMRCLGISSAQLRLWQTYDDESEDDDVPSSAMAKRTPHLIITSDLLIPGDGEPIPNGALVVTSKTIAWVGHRDAIPSKYHEGPCRVHHVPYMMPGLWDVHAHIVGPNPDPETAPRGLVYGPYGEHPASQGARLARGCWQALQCGYTSLRDCGGFGCEMANAINDGSIVGPNIYSCGGFISQTAGHGDRFDMPPGDALLHFGVNNIQPGFFCQGWGALADGVDECRRAVRLNVRRGAACIKILASGGVMSLDDDPLDAQFSEAEMSALVEEATRMGRAVAAHCHGKPGILASIKAGVRTIEHGTYADEECLDLIKSQGIILVPTAAVLEMLAGLDDAIPKKIAEKIKQVAAKMEGMYKMALAKGVTIAMGSDAQPSWLDASEIVYAVKMGMTSLQAIKAATATAPLTLGRRAPMSGQLKVGYDADILGLTADPIEDITVLKNSDNVGWVWKGGKLFKGPNVGLWGEE